MCTAAVRLGPHVFQTVLRILKTMESDHALLDQHDDSISKSAQACFIALNVLQRIKIDAYWKTHETQ